MAGKLVKVYTPGEVKRNHHEYDLGGFLYALRKAHNWSRSYVGDMTGRTQQSILALENSGHFPRIDCLLAIAKLYKVSPIMLFKKWLETHKEHYDS